MNRFITILVAILGSQFLVACSGDTYDNYAPVSKPVSREEPGEGQNNTPVAPILYDNGENGYAKTYNANLLVESIDSYEWAPRFDYVSDWILGVGLPNPAVSASNTTNLYFDFNYDRVYIHLPTFHPSVLGYDWMRWHITYNATDDWDRMEIDGSSTWGMIDCPDSSDGASKNIFHFEGKYDEANNAYKGFYAWTQESSEEGCVLSCTGAMTVSFHEVRM